MESREDWLMRPVVEGMCLYESLKNGAVDLEDIARMNDSIDVAHENQSRLEKAYEK